MSSYIDSLKSSDKERYERKFRSLYSKENQLIDPYKLSSDAWADDPSLWLEVEFTQI